MYVHVQIHRMKIMHNAKDLSRPPNFHLPISEERQPNLYTTRVITCCKALISDKEDVYLKLSKRGHFKKTLKWSGCRNIKWKYTIWRFFFCQMDTFCSSSASEYLQLCRCCCWFWKIWQDEQMSFDTLHGFFSPQKSKCSHFFHDLSLCFPP